MITPAILKTDALCKRFGNINAVDKVSIGIEQSEFFALLGPSGCGKTTLLRMLAGFETPTSGNVLLDGLDITRLPPARRPLNLMFQSYALFPHMTVAQNIAYGLEMENCAKPEIQRRVGEIIEMTLLTEFSLRKPAQLSGGQRQRVALARALVKKPRVLLLDEPLAALDKKLRTQMQLELKRMQHDIGISFIVVTHDQEEALVMADRIAVMNAGTVSQLATPKELYENPRNQFVAGFIGAMNFIPGLATANGIDVAGHGVLCARSGDTSIGEEVCLTVRPERINLHTAKPNNAENALLAEVYEIAYLGQDVKVHLKSCPGDITIEARQTSEQSEGTRFEAGQQLWCSWRAQDACLLSN